jgi:NAD(P)-dependent dehydrogenase (short-subunit alcohol dehydrogenase family)
VAERLKGKVALITGAGSGIGRAAALLFAAEGARVVASDITDGGEATVASIAAAGGEATFVRADVTKSDQVAAMVDHAVTTYGGLDCAFNNAGIGSDMMRLVDYDEDSWNRMLAVNLTSVWLCMKYEVPHLLARGGGAIVNTASILGVAGLAEFGAYVAAKHGVIGLTRSAALEYAADGVRVNAVCPSFTETPMVTETSVAAKPGTDAYRELDELHPAGRMGQPEEVAEAALWLCSDSASFIVGHPLLVDGGYVAR